MMLFHLNPAKDLYSQSSELFLLLIASFLVLYSCKKDDDEALVEDRDYTEQYVLDEQLIEDYLKTHFYNYEDFDTPISNNFEITLDSIYGENSNRTPLYDQIIKKKVPVIDKNGVVVDHNLYYLLAKSGLGQKPSNVDSAYVSYEGSLLNGKVTIAIVSAPLSLANFAITGKDPVPVPPPSPPVRNTISASLQASKIS